MKSVLSIIICLVAAGQLSTASAQVYQWKDSSGRTIISDSPPPAGAKNSRSVESDPAAAPPKTTAEKDVEFRKRLQEKREKDEKEAKELATAADRKDNCERAKRHLAAMESGERIVARDDKGGKRYLEDTERQQEVERDRKIIADSCK